MSELSRDKTPDKYKWDLTVLYKDEASFNKDVDEVLSLVEKFKKYQGYPLLPRRYFNISRSTTARPSFCPICKK